MGADPKYIYYDLLEHPEKYSDGVAEVLSGVISKGTSLKDLTDKELEVLNKATIEYAQTPPTKRKEASAKAQSRETEITPAGEEESAESDLPPYWWL